MNCTPIVILIASLLLCACNAQVAIEDIDTMPGVSVADTVYAYAFKPLDGAWKGKFLVYEDTSARERTDRIPDSLDLQYIHSLPLRLMTEVLVSQRYTSQSPFFQKVEISDTYADQNGDTVTVASRGVNKVQDGGLWCVVKKPDDLVIHRGTLPDAQTIIWQRSETDPQRIEYFQEIVLENRYTILGFGYYGDDDPALMPHYWFHGEYDRQ